MQDYSDWKHMMAETEPHCERCGDAGHDDEGRWCDCPYGEQAAAAAEERWRAYLKAEMRAGLLDPPLSREHFLPRPKRQDFLDHADVIAEQYPGGN